MNELNIPIKLYYNADGSLYLGGTKNKVPYVMKLSNLTYKLYLVTPYANTNYSFQAFFQKADGSVTNGFPMTFVETEAVEDEIWYVYRCDIESSVLTSSEYGQQNKLGINFYITDGNLTPTTLNTQPFNVKCTYAIVGGQNQIEETPLEQLQRTLDIALASKANINEVVYKISNATEYLNYVLSNDNIGYVYILGFDFTQPDGVWSKGTILIKNADQTFTIIGYSKDAIDTKDNDIINIITLGYTEVV